MAQVTTRWRTHHLTYDDTSSVANSGRHCEVSSPLLVWLLRGQGVELFGRTAARFHPPFKLPFPQHVHQLDAG